MLFENGAEKPVFTVSSKDVTFSEAKVQVDTDKMMLRVAGEVEFTQNPQWDPISWLMGDRREAVKDVEAHMRYWPHKTEFPQMQVESLLPRRRWEQGEPSWVTLPS